MSTTRQLWVVALVLAIIQAVAFAVSSIDIVVEYVESPACDWYCGHIPYVIAIFLPFILLISWVAAIVLAVLSIRTPGRSRVAGIVCLALCATTALTLVLQVTTHFMTGGS